MARRNIWGLALSLLLAPLVGPARGEILRYQDADGVWHFTDRPGAGAVPIPQAGPAPTKDRDLVAQLADWRGAASGSEPEPGLAVVAVRTSLAEGAGFFCSADGYILTTRHVVRPVGSDVWQHGQAAIAQGQGGLDEMEGQLQEWRSRLRRIDAKMSRVDQAEGPSGVQADGADADSQQGTRAQVARRVTELERLVRDAAGRRRVAQWFRREGDAWIGLDAGAPPGLAGRALPQAAFPTLTLRTDWPDARDAGLVSGYIAWLSPYLLTLPNLSDETRRSLEISALRHALVVDDIWRLYPRVLDPSLLAQARVEAKLRRAHTERPA